MERNDSRILAMHILAQAVCTHTHCTHKKTHSQKIKYPPIQTFGLSIQIKRLLDKGVLPFDAKKSIPSSCCSENPYTAARVTAQGRHGRRGVAYKGGGGHEKGINAKWRTKCFIWRERCTGMSRGRKGLLTRESMSAWASEILSSKAQWNHLKLDSVVKSTWHEQKYHFIFA